MGDEVPGRRAYVSNILNYNFYFYPCVIQQQAPADPYLSVSEITSGEAAIFFFSTSNDPLRLSLGSGYLLQNICC